MSASESLSRLEADVLRALATPASGEKHIRQEVRNDAELVHHCLSGSQEAWARLYHQCHQRLCEAIDYMLRRLGQHQQLTDEIAARVWFNLVRDSARLLAKFDAARDCRFGVFLVGLARNEILQYIRHERRRVRRERIGGHLRLESVSASALEMDRLMNEFAATLTEREQDFLQRFLLTDAGDHEAGPEAKMSAANVWQRRHRLREKLMTFLDGNSGSRDRDQSERDGPAESESL